MVSTEFTIKVRRDEEHVWVEHDPVLRDHEIGLMQDLPAVVIGNGKDRVSALERIPVDQRLADVLQRGFLVRDVGCYR